MNRAIYLALVLATAAAAQMRSGYQEYALVLEDAPVASVVDSREALRSARAQAQMSRVMAAQRSLQAELARRKIDVNGAVQTLGNIVFAAAPPSRVAELRTIPGVARVQRMPRLKMHLDRALDLVNVTQAWTSVGGAANAGAGIKIGIIDSGIDQTHPGFQDNSLAFPPGFPKGEIAYTNRKVVVARSYVSLLVDRTSDSSKDPQFSHPDDLTPRDRIGHGTAIAMIAAGVRNTGPAAAIQGVAPKAWLGNYKVFGSPAVNDLTLYSALAKAIEDALADGMDIVTMSLGEGDPAIDGPLDRDASCGPNGTVADCDVRSQLIESAVAKGLVVVASAGNGGDFSLQFPTLNSVQTPGVAPSAITVGASTNSHILYAGVTPQGGSRLNALFGYGGRPDAAFTLPLKDVTALGNDGLACAALPDNSLVGSIALVQRGTCVLSDKAYYAQAAGAAAVIIYQPSGNEYPLQITAQDVGIPVVSVGYTDGTTLKTAARNGRTVTIDPVLKAVDAPADTVWDSSSRGPAIGTFGIKPELVAVGTDLYTATQKLDPAGELYSADGYTSVTGTSYAVPMVAGAAALVKQKNPALTPGQIKSALVNTATPASTGLNGARVTDAGAGKLNAANAVNVQLAAEPATLSFGALVTGSLPANQNLRLTNVGSSAVTVNLVVNQRDRDTNASVRLSPTTATLQPRGQTTITVTLGGTRPSVGAYEGTIDISGVGAGPTMRVPYYYVVGDGVPFDAFPIIGAAITGTAGDDFWTLGMRVIDRYGVPVVGTPVTWTTVAGGGRINVADTSTVRYGVAAANPIFGNQLGDQIFTAKAGSLTVEFDGYAAPLPSIKAGGIVDAASNKIGTGLAPGSYAAIYGDGLAPTLSIARTASLPPSLATAWVSFDGGGTSAIGRLYFVSPGQINVQIPWDMQGQSSAQVKVTTGFDLSSSLVTLPLATYSPSIFVREGVAAVLDQDFKIVNTTNAAKRGAAVQIFCNGLGPVDNTPVSGEPTPAEPLARTRVNPSVQIGGRSAQVIFSGLTPGSVGLYQINAIVPTDAPVGNQPVIVTIGGVSSAAANMPVQ